MRFAAVVVACMLTACANRVDRIFVRDAQLVGAAGVPTDAEILDGGIYEAKGVSELTPWLGAPFEHPCDASYAR